MVYGVFSARNEKITEKQKKKSSRLCLAWFSFQWRKKNGKMIPQNKFSVGRKFEFQKRPICTSKWMDKICGCNSWGRKLDERKLENYME